MPENGSIVGLLENAPEGAPQFQRFLSYPYLLDDLEGDERARAGQLLEAYINNGFRDIPQFNLLEPIAVLKFRKEIIGLKFRHLEDRGLTEMVWLERSSSPLVEEVESLYLQADELYALARLSYNAEEFDRALEYIRQVKKSSKDAWKKVRQLPQDEKERMEVKFHILYVEAVKLQAYITYIRGRFGEAKNLYKEAWEEIRRINPQDLEIDDALELLEGKREEQAGKTEEAIKRYRLVLERSLSRLKIDVPTLFGSEIDIPVLLALAENGLDSERVHELFPPLQESLRLLGSIYAKSEDAGRQIWGYVALDIALRAGGLRSFVEAVRNQLEQLRARVDPDMVKKRLDAAKEFLEGWRLGKSGELDAARDKYLRAAELDSSETRGRYALAQYFYEQGKLVEALAWFNNSLSLAVGIHPEQHHLLLNILDDLGDVLLEMGRYADAVDILGRALERLSSLKETERAYWLKQGVQDSAKLQEASIAIRRAKAQLVYALDTGYPEDYEKAKKFTHTVLMIDVADRSKKEHINTFRRESFRLEAMVYLGLGQPIRALEQVENAFRKGLSPDIAQWDEVSLTALFSRGIIRLSLGELEAAVKDLEEVLRSGELYDTAILEVKRYLAEAYFRQRAIETAKQYLLEAMRFDEQVRQRAGWPAVELLLLSGQVYLQEGRWDQASLNLRRFIFEALRKDGKVISKDWPLSVVELVHAILIVDEAGSIAPALAQRIVDGVLALSKGLANFSTDEIELGSALALLSHIAQHAQGWGIPELKRGQINFAKEQIEAPLSDIRVVMDAMRAEEEALLALMQREDEEGMRRKALIAQRLGNDGLAGELAAALLAMPGRSEVGQGLRNDIARQLSQLEAGKQKPALFKNWRDWVVATLLAIEFQLDIRLKYQINQKLAGRDFPLALLLDALQAAPEEGLDSAQLPVLIEKLMQRASIDGLRALNKEQRQALLIDEIAKILMPDDVFSEGHPESSSSPLEPEAGQEDFKAEGVELSVLAEKIFQYASRSKTLAEFLAQIEKILLIMGKSENINARFLRDIVYLARARPKDVNAARSWISRFQFNYLGKKDAAEALVSLIMGLPAPSMPVIETKPSAELKEVEWLLALPEPYKQIEALAKLNLLHEDGITTVRQVKALLMERREEGLGIYSPHLVVRKRAYMLLRKVIDDQAFDELFTEQLEAEVENRQEFQELIILLGRPGPASSPAGVPLEPLRRVACVIPIILPLGILGSASAGWAAIVGREFISSGRYVEMAADIIFRMAPALIISSIVFYLIYSQWNRLIKKGVDAFYEGERQAIKNGQSSLNEEALRQRENQLAYMIGRIIYDPRLINLGILGAIIYSVGIVSLFWQLMAGSRAVTEAIVNIMFILAGRTISIYSYRKMRAKVFRFIRELKDGRGPSSQSSDGGQNQSSSPVGGIYGFESLEIIGRIAKLRNALAAQSQGRALPVAKVSAENIWEAQRQVRAFLAQTASEPHELVGAHLLVTSDFNRQIIQNVIGTRQSLEVNSGYLGTGGSFRKFAVNIRIEIDPKEHKVYLRESDFGKSLHGWGLGQLMLDARNEFLSRRFPGWRIFIDTRHFATFRDFVRRYPDALIDYFAIENFGPLACYHGRDLIALYGSAGGMLSEEQITDLQVNLTRGSLSRSSLLHKVEDGFARAEREGRARAKTVVQWIAERFGRTKDTVNAFNKHAFDLYLVATIPASPRPGENRSSSPVNRIDAEILATEEIWRLPVSYRGSIKITSHARWIREGLYQALPEYFSCLVTASDNYWVRLSIALREMLKNAIAHGSDMRDYLSIVIHWDIDANGITVEFEDEGVDKDKISRLIALANTSKDQALRRVDEILADAALWWDRTEDENMISGRGLGVYYTILNSNRFIVERRLSPGGKRIHTYVSIIKYFNGEGALIISSGSPVSSREDEAMVDRMIREVMAGKAPAWIAAGYRPGKVLVSSEVNGRYSIKGKIQRAKEHLYLATADPAVRLRVEKALDYLARHPRAAGLMLIEFEGVAQAIVKRLTGNNRAYQEYKQELDNALQALYQELHEELVMSNIGRKDALRKAMLYAGMGNIFDLGYQEKLRESLSILSRSPDGLRDTAANIFTPTQAIVIVDELKEFLARLQHSPPAGVILYFLDNHGEIIMDQLVIKLLILMKFRVVAVGRLETVRDDVTHEEAFAIFNANPGLKPFIDDGSLIVLTDGSYLPGADLNQSSGHPDFLAAWDQAIVFIAKGAGNFHSLFGQKLSKPGLFIRMMKEQGADYRLLEESGRRIIARAPLDLIFAYQKEDSSVASYLEKIRHPRYFPKEKKIDHLLIAPWMGFTVFIAIAGLLRLRWNLYFVVSLALVFITTFIWLGNEVWDFLRYSLRSRKARRDTQADSKGKRENGSKSSSSPAGQDKVNLDGRGSNQDVFAYRDSRLFVNGQEAKRISQGTHGVVFESPLDVTEAIKWLPGRGVIVRTEFDRLLQLSRAEISPRAIRYGIAGKDGYLVIDKVEGMTVRQMIREGRLTREDE
ncbi:DUF89 family protein, partial [bacterium]